MLLCEAAGMIGIDFSTVARFGRANYMSPCLALSSRQGEETALSTRPLRCLQIAVDEFNELYLGQRAHFSAL